MSSLSPQGISTKFLYDRLDDRQTRINRLKDILLTGTPIVMFRPADYEDETIFHKEVAQVIRSYPVIIMDNNNTIQHVNPRQQS